MNCAGCGVVVDASQEEIDSVVDQVLTVSVADAQRHGGVCPLCGHSKQRPYWNRRSILLAILFICLALLMSIKETLRRMEQSERSVAADAAVAQMQQNPAAVQLLGTPIKAEPGIGGRVTRDETGWREARLKLLVSGPKGEGEVTVAGDRDADAWRFTTFEVVVEKQHKKLDLVSGRIVVYEPDAYVDVHTMAARTAEYLRSAAPAPTSDGSFPCLWASIGERSAPPTLGRCETPTTHAADVDRVEVDLRYGSFVLRQTDLRIDDVFAVPLTRSYRSDDWVSHTRTHAFGNNSNHPYDIAPLGTRNPYTYQTLVLEDGSTLYFERISKGTGYADAVYQHSETSTRFYKATETWNGNGWTIRLSDGSEIRFPESYQATNLAQGAANLMRDASGNELHLNRDPQRNLKEIATPHSRWIRFEYDDHARITKAENSSGDWAKYAYDPGGMLESVRHSSGHERRYTYDRMLLTSITDEHGQVLLRNTYVYGLLVRQQYGDGSIFYFRYKIQAMSPFAESAKVTLPHGDERTIETGSAVPAYIRQR